MASTRELALSEAIRRLAEQQASINQARATAGTVLAAATISTSFLADVALDTQVGLPWRGWAAVICLGLTVLCCFGALWPRKLSTTIDATTLIDDDRWAQLDDDRAAEHLSRFLGKRANAHEGKIDLAWQFVCWAMIATGVSIALWCILIADR